MGAGWVALVGWKKKRVSSCRRGSFQKDRKQYLRFEVVVEVPVKASSVLASDSMQTQYSSMTLGSNFSGLPCSIRVSHTHPGWTAIGRQVSVLVDTLREKERGRIANYENERNAASSRAYDCSGLADLTSSFAVDFSLTKKAADCFGSRIGCDHSSTHLRYKSTLCAVSVQGALCRFPVGDLLP